MNKGYSVVLNRERRNNPRLGRGKPYIKFSKISPEKDLTSNAFYGTIKRNQVANRSTSSRAWYTPPFSSRCADWNNISEIGSIAGKERSDV